MTPTSSFYFMKAREALAMARLRPSLRAYFLNLADDWRTLAKKARAR